METKETLEKQLQLLSERSEYVADEALCDLSREMVKIAEILLALDGSLSFYGDSIGHPYVVQLPAKDLADLYAARAELLTRRAKSHRT